MTRHTFASALVIGAFFSAATPVWADDPEFNLVIKDHRFTPADLQIPARTKVRLVIKNEDSTPEEFESAQLHREKVVPPGQQIVVIVGPLDAGTYPFFGDFHKDTARGKLIAK